MSVALDQAAAMPLNAERRSQPITVADKLPGEDACAWQEQLEQQMARIRRIGRQLFGVADCVILFRCHECEFPAATARLGAGEAFCASLPYPEGSVAVPDLRRDLLLSEHASATATPSVRFYAAHPLRNPEGTIIGSISLVDYAPRAFDEGAGRMLADLAALVEREMQLQSLNAQQIALQKKNKSLRRRTLVDPMLKIWNRGAILRILGIEADRCDKQGLPLALIVVDLDFFKKINDSHGHPAGDAVLINVAARLRSCLRPQEALGRYGGEEFLVVLPGACHETALAIGERMREAVAAQDEIVGGVTLHLSISAGIASTVQFPSASTDELISLADTALYAAKDAGRNRVMQALPAHA
ncbi:sensor domain-containing diguanylate cyclase [Janthinobacterium sp. 17J80-10]|uniref:sensor domain-containing diguanylate cyclase n=1 Tax=Janthinobacterium sp. 17J80-10 TaxID=2497863 RepID=UPI001005A8AB|nr:sensor domain-containing diguanylate cyclase [Janthinobacterium sp. 17J80-10]QAU34606.1 sensor domain-containing diguanylate cyclase [Janthinobacterium sp. 17J80-10]